MNAECPKDENKRMKAAIADSVAIVKECFEYYEQERARGYLERVLDRLEHMEKYYLKP
jgi:hypothetical protein